MITPAGQRFLGAAEIASSILDDELLDKLASQLLVHCSKAAPKLAADLEHGRAERDDLGSRMIARITAQEIGVGGGK